MHCLPFAKPGSFWRGNLHTHSTISDGKLSPEMICARYRDNGYDFVALTDHFALEWQGRPWWQNPPVVPDTRSYRTGDFTTLIGVELVAGKSEFGGSIEALAIGLPVDFAPPTAEEASHERMARVFASGAFTAVTHPAAITLTEQDILSLGRIDAIEVSNGSPVTNGDRGNSAHVLDVLLSRGQRYSLIATDDAHEAAHVGRGWVYVKSESLSPESLLAALKAGAFYSSTGLQIHNIEIIPGEKVIVDCAPADCVFLFGTGWDFKKVCGSNITHAEFNLENYRSPFGRVVVTNNYRQGAWSNPFWFD